MLKDLLSKNKLLSVTGLGYVGLPLALAFAKKCKVIAFDIDPKRIALLNNKMDPSQQIQSEEFEDVDITFTNEADDLFQAHFHIIAVPTDIDDYKVPDLSQLISATESIGRFLKKGDYVVYESTVYPGCTEEECLPLLESFSGLSLGADFKLGYSPERINPGDNLRTLTKIPKVVSGNDSEALEVISDVYGSIITAGLHQASSIVIAEASKVVENTQRDINISLINELAIIFDKIGIDTSEVLEAAGTKWNFHKYQPGLVGGHCISVDPFYLLHKAKQLGHDPQVIAAGRRVNDYIPHFIAKSLIQELLVLGKNPSQCKVLVKGLTFKENVADIRNSKVVDLIMELKSYSVTVDVEDPGVSASEVERQYQLSLITRADSDYDAVVIAVKHDQYVSMPDEGYLSYFRDKPIVFDLKRAKPGLKKFKNLTYWTL